MFANNRVKAIIYSILAFIVAVIGIRMLLMLIGANQATPFVRFWNSFSLVFIAPWVNIFSNIYLTSGSYIELSSAIAMLFYLLLAVMIDGTVAEFRSGKTEAFLYGIFNAIFKIIEGILATRFLLKLFAASQKSLFVNVVYGLSQIVYEPFAGIIRDYRFEGIIVEFSTLLILVIVILLDIAFDRVLRSILERE